MRIRVLGSAAGGGFPQWTCGCRLCCLARSGDPRTRPATQAQVDAWKILVKVLRARYGIPLDHVYAHNWIDYKDARYCEGCALATLAREWGK